MAHSDPDPADPADPGDPDPADPGASDPDPADPDPADPDPADPGASDPDPADPDPADPDPADPDPADPDPADPDPADPGASDPDPADPADPADPGENGTRVPFRRYLSPDRNIVRNANYHPTGISFARVITLANDRPGRPAAARPGAADPGAPRRPVAEIVSLTHERHSPVSAFKSAFLKKTGGPRENFFSSRAWSSHVFLEKTGPDLRNGARPV